MCRTGLAVLIVCCSLTAQAEEQDLAYSLGVRLGERLRTEVPALPLNDLLEGLRQAYAGQPLRLTDAHITRLLEEHEAQMETASARTAQTSTAEQDFLAAQRALPRVRPLDNGVLVSELRAGNGPRPTARSHVQVRYRGTLADGSLFDESREAQWFRLDSLIAGWRSALLQMPKGAHWRLVVPSAQAYGPQGAGDLIPPDAPLIFDLELLDVAN